MGVEAEIQTQRRVLIVDDDPNVRESLQRGLTLCGFDVVTADDGPTAITAHHQQNPDAIVLDLQMPRMDGLGVITALRAYGSDVPICVLSARSAADDRIEGLEAGADDYLIKPFVFDELTARLRALLRRSRNDRTDGREGVTIGSLHIDLSGRRIYRAGVAIDLTRREYELLTTLSDNIGVVLTREQLLEKVWGYDFATDTNVVDVFISYLRRKLESNGEPRLIHTVRGVGYVLRQDHR